MTKHGIMLALANNRPSAKSPKKWVGYIIHPQILGASDWGANTHLSKSI